MTIERLAIASGLALVLAGCASEGPRPRPPTETTETTREGDTIERTRTITTQAKVVAIDHGTRLVTVEGADGETVTFHVDERVRNLDQVRKGDMVNAVYKRAVVARLMKRSDPDVPTDFVRGMTTAEPGQKPAAEGAQLLEMTATIVKIDRAKREVTLQVPEGDRVTVAVENPSLLDGIKAGDRVDVTYVQSVAISVDEPAK